jgi:hypothetical protein
MALNKHEISVEKEMCIMNQVQIFLCKANHINI